MGKNYYITVTRSLQIGQNTSIGAPAVSAEKILLQNGDSELKQTLEQAKAEKIANKRSVARLLDERFLSMTGMTFKEKSFRNMIEFYKPELKKIIESEKQYIAIMNLPKNIRRTLKNNGIIAYGRKNLRITSDARKYLPKKEE